MSLYREQGSTFWWCRFRVNGQTIRKSTGTADRRRAEVEERRLRAYYESKAPARRTGRAVGLADLGGHDCDEAIARGVSADQLRLIKNAWHRIVKHFGPDTLPTAVTFDSVQRYIAARRQEGVRGQTIVVEVQALKRACRIAHRRGFLPWVPDEWPVVRRDPPKQAQRGKLHPPEIIADWLRALPEDARDEATTILLTGLRAQEAKRVTAQWVEPAPQGSGVPAILRVPAEASKTRRERVIGLVPAVVEILRRRALGASTDGPLFFQGSSRRQYRQAIKAIGYDRRITLRDLRHTFSTLAAAGTGDAAAVQAALGHTDLATTQRYLSSTISRTAGASLAVASTFAGVLGDAQFEAQSGQSKVVRGPINAFYGAKNGIRTRDLLITKRIPELLDHVSTCFSCAERVAACANLRVIDGEVDRGEWSEVDPHKKRGGQ